MKKNFIFIVLMWFVTLHAHEVTPNHVEARQLKQWIDAKQQIQILDARPAEYDDGRRISAAISLPYNSPDEAISSKVSPNLPIVVYCGGPSCPASGWLAERLVKMGYKNVYEYSGGVEKWQAAGYTFK